MQERKYIIHQSQIYIQDIECQWHDEHGKFVAYSLAYELDQLLYVAPTIDIPSPGQFILFVDPEQIKQAKPLLLQLLKSLKEADP